MESLKNHADATAEVKNHSTNRTNPQASLKGLPAELQLGIGRALPIPDNHEHRDTVLDLRLVCKVLGLAANEIFLERYFTRRRHLVEDMSLQRLGHITSSAWLCRKLDSIDLVFGGFSDDWFGFELTSWMSGKWSEIELARGRLLMKLLVGILRNLKSQNVLPSLELSSPLATDLQNGGRNWRMVRAVSENPEYYPDCVHRSGMIMTMLLAINDSAYPVQDLTLFDDSKEVADCFLECPTTAYIDLDMFHPEHVIYKHDIFRHLKSLSLTFGLYLNTSRCEADQESHADVEVSDIRETVFHFWALFTAATSLRHLTLHMTHYHSENIGPNLEAIEYIFAGLHLESISLYDTGIFSDGALTQCLKTWKSTLRRLELSGSATKGPQTWAQILRELASDLNLDYMHVGKIYSFGRSQQRIITIEDKSEWKFDSDVKKGISMLAAEVDGWLDLQHALEADDPNY